MNKLKMIIFEFASKIENRSYNFLKKRKVYNKSRMSGMGVPAEAKKKGEIMQLEVDSFY